MVAVPDRKGNSVQREIVARSNRSTEVITNPRVDDDVLCVRWRSARSPR